MIDRVNIVDIMVDKINLEEAKTRVLEFIEDYHTGGGEKQTRMIVTPNSEMIVLARHDPELKAILNRADLSIPDGAGVVLASRIMGNPVPERVAGFDLMQELFSLADSNNFSIYLLGGTAEVIEKVRKDLRKKYPGLKICGSHHGYLNQDIVEEVINDIDKCSPDLLFVGMGVPGQEKFLADNLQRIKAGVALTVGGSFDVLAGQVKRAPDWICKIYLEWLFRLCQEPSRFWRMLALPRFVLLVFFRFLRKYFLDYLGITAGSALIALGLTSFLIPNRIAAGGVSGLATVIFHLTQIPVGIMVLIINLPLFLVSIKILGRSFGARTIYGVISLSFFIDLLQPVVPVITRDLLLASIYGGIIGGLGLGLVFKARGTTGGTDMVARIINHYTGLSTGQGLLLADGFVVMLAAIFFNIEVALYAAVTIFINSKTIDLIQEGLSFTRASFIISSQPDKIRKGIISTLDRGVTVLNGYGGYTDEKKQVLLCIISRSEIVRLKNIVYQIDPGAFMIITDVHEVLGEGFKKFS